jgi:anti-sigma regulatory factor (Ser/Thr protein kinase)
MSEQAEHAASLSVPLRSERSELVRLAELVAGFAAEHRLPDHLLMNVQLVLDELVSNVIKYGNASDRTGAIEVSLTIDGARLTIAVSDDGVAFNPLDATPPDLDLPLVDRPVGGLGIHIVKTLAETIAYRRENGRNQIVLTLNDGQGELKI